jgi:hypothetical protein
MGRRGEGVLSENRENRLNEELATSSDRFLEVMSKSVHKYGGDIVQYLGNSLVAVWYPFKEKAEKRVEFEDDIGSRREFEVARRVI